MTDLDTALRAADFHVPDAAKVIREHLEALREKIRIFEIFECFVIGEGVWERWQPLINRAEQAERERDALRVERDRYMAALQKIEDFESKPRTPVRTIVQIRGIARASLYRGEKPND